MQGFSLEPSDEVRETRDWLHEFARTVIRPAAEEWDEREETPWPVLQEAAKIGLYSPDFFLVQSLEESGLGLAVTFEELFWGDAGIGLSLLGTCLAVASVTAMGTPEQVMEWVPQMFGTPDEVKVAAFCSSEPDAGSDVGSIRCRAVYDEARDEWTLNGTKTWATNGGIADVHVVVASVHPELGSRAQALGVARAAYEYALDYSREREQFGRKIGDFQAVAFKLADMRTRIDASRMLVWRAAWMARQNLPFDNAEGSMAELYASETAVHVTEEAIQILGGNGYTRDYPVERMHRDSKIFTIFEGTSEIQRLVIGRALTGPAVR